LPGEANREDLASQVDVREQPIFASHVLGERDDSISLTFMPVKEAPVNADCVYNPRPLDERQAVGPQQIHPVLIAGD
jgi:hypothetical protein